MGSPNSPEEIYSLAASAAGADEYTKLTALKILFDSTISTSSLPYNDAGPTAVDREGSGDNVVVIDTEGGA